MKIKINKILIFITITCILISMVSCGEKNIKPTWYYDLSTGSKAVSSDVAENYKYVVVDNNGGKLKGEKYLAHPDMINILKDGQDIQYVFYVNGHGRGETRIKKSVDQGKTWEQITNLPDSFNKTQETPCTYTLNFIDGSIKYILISGRPGWSTFPKKGEGFDVSVSEDMEHWSTHINFYGTMAQDKQYYASKGTWNCIVAMASLVQIMENGKPVDKWMGFFHDYEYNIYATVLTFNQGKMHWSKPEKVFKKYKKIEKKVGLCEPLVIRNPEGNELMMLMRANNKNSKSMYSVSRDEGITWSEPKVTSLDLTGERHKAVCLDDNKIMITMRKIDYYNGKIKKSNFYSRGFCAWIGNYDDIKSEQNGLGDLIKIEHTYKDVDEITAIADADTGYAGIIKTSQGNVIVVSYGKFDKNDKKNTIIISKTINIAKFYEDIKEEKIKKIYE